MQNSKSRVSIFRPRRLTALRNPVMKNNYFGNCNNNNNNNNNNNDNNNNNNNDNNKHANKRATKPNGGEDKENNVACHPQTPPPPPPPLPPTQTLPPSHYSSVPSPELLTQANFQQHIDFVRFEMSEQLLQNHAAAQQFIKAQQVRFASAHREAYVSGVENMKQQLHQRINQERRLNSQITNCTVCQVQPRSCVFLCCRAFTTCKKCAKVVPECPSCGASTKGKAVFMDGVSLG